MKPRRKASQAMTKGMDVLSLFLAAVVTLVMAVAPPYCWADDDGNEMPFKDAEFFIEYNSTAGDTGVQVFLDDDNWREITISDPNEKTLFMVKGKTTLGRQGLTELFFESVEPELASLPMVRFLKRFPEGDYEFQGIRNDGIELESEVEFTHVIPCGPEVMPKEGELFDPDSEVVISWEEVDEIVDPVATDDDGETVCTVPDDDQELEIDKYQVIIENDDIHLIVDLPADATSLTIPSEIIQTNTAYKFEVLAKEASGNQTITEGFFCTTGLDVTEEEDCEKLADAL